MDERDMVLMASQLGHRVGIYPRESGRWSWWCTCDKPTASRVSSSEALSAALHHARQVVAAAAANGGVLPLRSVGGRS